MHQTHSHLTMNQHEEQDCRDHDSHVTHDHHHQHPHRPPHPKAPTSTPALAPAHSNPYHPTSPLVALPPRPSKKRKSMKSSSMSVSRLNRLFPPLQVEVARALPNALEPYSHHDPPPHPPDRQLRHDPHHERHHESSHCKMKDHHADAPCTSPISHLESSSISKSASILQQNQNPNQKMSMKPQASPTLHSKHHHQDAVTHLKDNTLVPIPVESAAATEPDSIPVELRFQRKSGKSPSSKKKHKSKSNNRRHQVEEMELESESIQSEEEALASLDRTLLSAIKIRSGKIQELKLEGQSIVNGQKHKSSMEHQVSISDGVFDRASISSLPHDLPTSSIFYPTVECELILMGVDIEAIVPASLQAYFQCVYISGLGNPVYRCCCGDFSCTDVSDFSFNMLRKHVRLIHGKMNMDQQDWETTRKEIELKAKSRLAGGHTFHALADEKDSRKRSTLVGVDRVQAPKPKANKPLQVGCESFSM